MTKAKRVEWPNHGIKTIGLARTSTGASDGIRYVIDPSEQQVIDNRGGTTQPAAQEIEAQRRANIVAA